MSKGEDLLPVLQQADCCTDLTPNLQDYAEVILMMSGGKDSLACLLDLLDRGVPREKIHLHHHLVDGREGGTLMDWECTEGYVEALAKAFGLKLTYSWREGGIERECNRHNAPTAPVMIPDEIAGYRRVGGDGPLGTRRMFPQQAASLQTRWCSAYCKIGCADAYLINEPRFRGGRKTLVITGERAEESANRARYAMFEPHRADLRNGKTVCRHIDHWRPVLRWSAQQVWAIIERWRVQAHPAYELGFGRVSCRCCVFGSSDQWATIKVIAPEQFRQVADKEREFGVTIHRKRSVEESAVLGTPYATNPFWVEVANSRRFELPIFVSDWKLPPGAYGESCGPT
jgi:3'-phosphoadenosine 5'-phosphosulfate sulfotransferase (PAPS reductase)/FAD synthetase